MLDLTAGFRLVHAPQFILQYMRGIHFTLWRHPIDVI